MSARLLILIVVVAGLAVYFAVRTSAPADKEPQYEPEISAEELQHIRVLQTDLSKRDLPGEEPAEPADLSIQWEVDPTGEKHRIYYYITEAHGYYVETFNIDFYYMPTPDTTYEESPLLVSTYVDDYLKANDTFKGCLEVVSAELARVGGDMGTTENWGAEIDDYGRARTQNPDPLPPLKRVAKCD